MRFTRAAARQTPCRPRPLPTPATIPLIHSIAPLADGDGAWLVDIWGVIHNGVRPFTDACDACTRYREGGGIVVLVSNSPRPHDGVAAQLDGVGVPRASWDAIVTSGDVARTLIAALFRAGPFFHIGPERDLPMFAGLDVERVEREATPRRSSARVCSTTSARRPTTMRRCCSSAWRAGCR